jgi:TolB-like protein
MLRNCSASSLLDLKNFDIENVNILPCRLPKEPYNRDFCGFKPQKSTNPTGSQVRFSRPWGGAKERLIMRFRTFIFGLFALAAILGCASPPPPPPPPAPPPPPQEEKPISVKPASPDSLDAAIREASDYLNNNIPQGSMIVILNIQSVSEALSDYVIDGLIANAVNDRIFKVVDRQQLDLIRAEQEFQLSGSVDDKLAVSIGKFLGAQTIVSGRVRKLDDRYRMTIRALDVETAQVQGQYNQIGRAHV